MNRRARSSRPLWIAATIFIFGYFLFFRVDGFNTTFSGDDGMNLVHLHHHWEWPFQKSIVDALTVFTPAYRPMGALFYRSMYQWFGFHSLPFRIVFFAMMTANLAMLYPLSRWLGAAPFAAALACLLFSYNASMMDFEYNTGTIYDVLCFLFYFSALLIYVHRRRTAASLRVPEMAAILVLYAAALDSKELGVTLPAACLLYELLYRLRDLRRSDWWLRTGTFQALLLAMAAWYSHVKVSEMSGNDLYRPSHSLNFILNRYGHYFDVLTYRVDGSLGAVGAVAVALLLIALCLLARSRAGLFGMLFYLGVALPVTTIAPRGGFAVYVAFPGLAMAVACLVDAALSACLKRRPSIHAARWRIALFLLIAIVAGRYHLRVRNKSMYRVHWDQTRLQEITGMMKEKVPSLPEGFRILVDDDTFAPGDWLVFFLTQMRYHDSTLWLDRSRGMETPPDPAGYHLAMRYRTGTLESVPARWFGHRFSWEPRVRHWRPSTFEVTSCQAEMTPRAVELSRSTARPGERILLHIPGAQAGKLEAVYRIIHDGDERRFQPKPWCQLDTASRCEITVPAGSGNLMLDWVLVPGSPKWQRVVASLKIGSD